MGDKDKKNNPQIEQDNHDIEELTDAFLSYMDDVISEEEEKKENKVIPDLLTTRSNEEESYDNSYNEDELGAQYDSGYFEKREELKGFKVEYEEVSESKEKRIFYSALYLSGKPIEIATFRKMMNPINLENRLLNYAEEFNRLNIGIRIRMVSGGYQVVTDADVTGFLEKYFGEKTESLSKASLETVAIIAYKQPITKAEIEELRGVNSSGTMKYLLDKNLIKVEGRKQVPGKPLLYVTTKYFLEYFGLNDLSELPTFREWQELKQNQ